MFGNLFWKKQNRENYLAAWDRKNETEPSVLSLSWLNLFSEKNCNTKYDVYGTSPIAKKRKKFLPDRFNSTVICAGSTVSKIDICTYSPFYVLFSLKKTGKLLKRDTNFN